MRLLLGTHALIWWLAGDYRHPFYRMLVAQAREEKMALVSNEVAFDIFRVVRLW